jgi:hypothetical protein
MTLLHLTCGTYQDLQFHEIGDPDFVSQYFIKVHDASLCHLLFIGNIRQKMQQQLHK